MAKINGPLFSFAASGTVADRLCYRTTRGGAVVQLPPIPTGAPSTAQVETRARFLAASDAWAALDPATKDAWMAAGLAHGKPARQLWLAEWTVQQCTADRLPLIPAKNF